MYWFFWPKPVKILCWLNLLWLVHDFRYLFTVNLLNFLCFLCPQCISGKNFFKLCFQTDECNQAFASILVFINSQVLFLSNNIFLQLVSQHDLWNEVATWASGIWFSHVQVICSHAHVINIDSNRCTGNLWAHMKHQYFLIHVCTVYKIQKAVADTGNIKSWVNIFLSCSFCSGSIINYLSNTNLITGTCQ